MFFKKSKSFDITTVLAGCLAGRASAQKQLYQQYYGLSKSIAMRYAGNQEEAEEMVNDCFLKVFSKLDQYQASFPFEAWFRTVVVRTCIDYYRKNQDRFQMVEVSDIPNLAFDDDLLSRLQADEIIGLVQKLPPAYRAVFSLYVIEGYAHAEIAEMLQINEGTSRSNLAKARTKLQGWIKSYLGEDINERNHV